MDPIISTTVPAYGLGKDLLQIALKSYRDWSAERARSAIAQCTKGYQSELLMDYLEWRYPKYPLLRIAGHRFPITVFPTPVGGRSTPESVLSKPIARARQGDELLLPGSARFRALAQKVGLGPTDRACFTMRRLDTTPAPKLTCEFGSYFRMLDTCDELEWETLSNYQHLDGSSRTALEQFDMRLPLRTSVHDAVDDPVVDGSRRSVSIAISALVAFREEGRVCLLMKRRGLNSVAVHRGMIHVLPAFMFQPATDRYDIEFGVRHNFEREYLEELFNREEPEAQEGDARYFYSDERLEYFRQLESRGQVRVELTGVGVNLLNLRPEICLLVTIDTDEWHRHHRQHRDPAHRFSFNNEFLRAADMSHNAETAVGQVEYLDDEVALLARAGIRPWDLVPSGAAALSLGKVILDERRSAGAPVGADR